MADNNTDEDGYSSCDSDGSTIQLLENLEIDSKLSDIGEIVMKDFLKELDIDDSRLLGVEEVECLT